MNMSAKSTLAIALTALAAGAALGVLLAPASGKDTRKKLVRKGTDLRERLSDMLDEGGDLIDKLKGDASELANKAKDTANTSKDRVKEAAAEASSAQRTTANGGYKG
jgi:gas vesicle protein